MSSYVIEGIANLTEEEGRHEQRFYELLLPIMSDQHSSATLFFKEKYNKILHVCKSVENGIEAKDLIKQGYTQAGVWSKKYKVFRFGSSEVVVVDEEGVDVDQLTRPTYYEKVFADISAIHKEGHHKGKKLFEKCRAIYSNIPRNVCKIFTDTCPMCTRETIRKKPTAGVKNIITDGFGVRGQVDLIDFQSTPDGEFKYLLQYVDHGVKKLNIVPLTSKRASTVAYALCRIFTEQGPPCILQADNGREFYGQAAERSDRQLILEDNVSICIIMCLAFAYDGLLR